MPMPRKLWFLLALDAAAIVPGIVIVAIREQLWTLVVPTTLLLVLVITLLWPSGGTHGYFSYRTPLVLASFVAELWLIVGGLAIVLPADRLLAAVLFQGFLAVFFLLSTINSLPGMTGVSRPGAGTRPDLIFGGGVYLVRGEIYVALGIEILTSPHAIALPVWNWWAVAAEVAAMLILVAFRGVLKMQMRQARFLGHNTWKGSGLRAGMWVREVFLYFALLLVVYAFFNMFRGLVPFTWTPGQPHGGNPDWTGLGWLAAAFVLLVPVRGWWKTRLPEPPTLAQELAKQLLMWVGFVLLITGFLLVFAGQIGTVDWFGGYYNFWWGLWVSLLGFLMVVPLRTITLREEFRGTVKITTGSVGELPEQQRQRMLRSRLSTVAALGPRERTIHLGLILSAVQAQPSDRRQALQQTRQAVLANAPDDARQRLQDTAAELHSRDGGDPDHAARHAMT